MRGLAVASPLHPAAAAAARRRPRASSSSSSGREVTSQGWKYDLNQDRSLGGSLRVGQSPGSLHRHRSSNLLRPAAAAIAVKQDEVNTYLPKGDMWSVHKFGGTCMGTPQRIQSVADIVLGDSSERKLIIVSAMSKVTDMMYNLVHKAQSRDDSYTIALEEVFEKHMAAAKDLLDGEDLARFLSQLHSDVSNLRAMLRAIYIAGHATESFSDFVVGHGELWSAQMLSYAIKKSGAPCSWMDTREVLVVKPSGSNQVDPDYLESEKRLQKWFSRQPAEIIVATGFIASTEENIPTTLKRDGSDFSAAIIGSLVRARQVTIWTDVDGVFSADPRKVSEAVILSTLSYQEAWEMSYFGANVLHPRTIIPVMKDNIPIVIRNMFNLSAPGTVICRQPANDNGESDLRVGNTGISDKDGCWTESDESDWDKSYESDSDESDYLGRRYKQFLESVKYKSLKYKSQILRFMVGEPLKRLLMLPEIIDRLLMRPEVFKHILMEPELLARLLMEPELLARLLMEPELLARLLKKPVLLARLLKKPVLLALLLKKPVLLARLLNEPVLLARMLKKPVLLTLLLASLLKEPVLLARVLKKPELCYQLLMGLRLSALHFVNSDALHGPDCLSVRNTAMQVKLPSYKTVHDTLAYPKSVVPKTNIHMAGRHGSFYSQPMCVAVRNDGTMSGSNSMVEPLGHAEKPATIHLKSGNSIGTSSKPSLVVLRDTCTQETKDIISAKQRPGDDGFLLNSGVYHSTTAKDIGNVASKKILMLSMADNAGSSSEGNGTTLTSGNYQRGADLVTNHKPIVILDTGAEVNVTGDEAIFVGVVDIEEGFGLRAANESGMTSNCFGFVSHEMFQINCVYYCKDVGVRTIISGPELDLLGYTYRCGGGVCEVWDKETLVGKGRLVDKKKYLMDFLILDRAVVPSPEVPDGTGPLPMAPLSEVLEEVSVALRELRTHIGAADGTGPLPMAPLSEVPEVEQADVPGPLPMAPLSEEPAQVTSVLMAVWTALRRFIGSQFKRTSTGTEAQRRPPV